MSTSAILLLCLCILVLVSKTVKDIRRAVFFGKLHKMSRKDRLMYLVFSKHNKNKPDLYNLDSNNDHLRL